MGRWEDEKSGKVEEVKRRSRNSSCWKNKDEKLRT